MEEYIKVNKPNLKLVSNNASNENKVVMTGFELSNLLENKVIPNLEKELNKLYKEKDSLPYSKYDLSSKEESKKALELTGGRALKDLKDLYYTSKSRYENIKYLIHAFERDLKDRKISSSDITARNTLSKELEKSELEYKKIGKHYTEMQLSFLKRDSLIKENQSKVSKEFNDKKQNLISINKGINDLSNEITKLEFLNKNAKRIPNQKIELLISKVSVNKTNYPTYKVLNERAFRTEVRKLEEAKLLRR